ncbi:MAG: MerR family DNA-binding transcriptional regulator [Actinobacteria bacterium]|nr:MerR family DNA-binding transcriptional regulator [Actinomycetota bacterium]
MSTRKPLTIGETINLLKDEFPDVTVSKLRFLESQGLIHPERSASGYREFRAGDIDRIRYILRQQRDHFLPLRVIKSKLTAWERGEEPTVPAAEGAPAEAYFANSGARMTAEELARTAGIHADLVHQLVAAGIIRPRGPEDAPFFTDDDLAIARAAHRLTGLGLDTRHLRSMQLGANREADLLGQLAGPLLRHRSPSGHRQAAELLADAAQGVRDLQEALLRDQLRRLLESP